MAEITGRKLKLLDRLFGFKADANTAPLEFSTESPIQPVYDVSRPAEIASGFPANVVAPGIFLLGSSNVHAGGDTIFAGFNPRTPIRSAAPVGLPDSDLEWDLWWLGAFAFSVDVDMGAAAQSLVLFYPPIAAAPTTLGRLLFYADGGINSADFAATGNNSFGRSVTTNIIFPRPLLLPAGSLLNCRTTAPAADAGTIHMFSEVWAGPRGARPPGLA